MMTRKKGVTGSIDPHELREMLNYFHTMKDGALAGKRKARKRKVIKRHRASNPVKVARPYYVQYKKDNQWITRAVSEDRVTALKHCKAWARKFSQYPWRVFQ